MDRWVRWRGATLNLIGARAEHRQGVGAAGNPAMIAFTSTLRARRLERGVRSVAPCGPVI